MSAPETFIAFGLVMLVVALLAVAIDWFGKPFRHRRFVPKMYRYPDERGPRRPRAAEQSAPVEPPAYPYPPATAQPATSARQPFPVITLEPDDTDLDESAPDEPHDAPHPDGTDLDALDDAPHPDGTDDAESPSEELAEVLESGPPSRSGGPDDRRRGWSPGDYVFNFTAEGHEPAPSTVRTRYWRNVAEARGAAIFGSDNVERMRAGKAPQRRNPRTGKTEAMRLHAVTFEDTGGETPLPAWPDTSVDPFL